MRCKLKLKLIVIVLVIFLTNFCLGFTTKQIASNEFWLYGDSTPYDNIQIIAPDVSFYDVESDYYLHHSERVITLKPGKNLLSKFKFRNNGQLWVRNIPEGNVLYKTYIPEPMSVVLLAAGFCLIRCEK